MDPKEQIEWALDTLNLPKLVTRNEIKDRYRALARQHHPDISRSDKKMEEINRAYDILKEYIDTFRYRFDEIEIAQHYPEGDHAQKFRF